MKRLGFRSTTSIAATAANKTTHTTTNKRDCNKSAQTKIIDPLFSPQENELPPWVLLTHYLITNLKRTILSHLRTLVYKVCQNYSPVIYLNLIRRTNLSLLI